MCFGGWGEQHPQHLLLCIQCVQILKTLLEDTQRADNWLHLGSSDNWLHLGSPNNWLHLGSLDNWLHLGSPTETGIQGERFLPKLHTFSYFLVFFFNHEHILLSCILFFKVNFYIMK